ncbi:unnamed protein product [Phytophthora lilii]|uniref:Unnamed protein product n=1 Tax=Phytophthora lilii TaxID=2077276 RepID=A0A9W6X0N2_9STRA|nr:unnamed protein product [Phytophthora lilii]
MNESLAARQEALRRQNQELNQQVDAIEQRRQQLTTASRPSSSSSSASLRGTRSSSPQAESPVRKSEPEDDLSQHSDLKTSLEIELSASIDSLGSQDLKEARRQLAKSESKEKVAAGSRHNSAKRAQRQKKQAGGDASPQDAPRMKKQPSSGTDSPDHVDPIQSSSPGGLGLEATVRYQKARLRVLQDEADAAVTKAEYLVRFELLMTITLLLLPPSLTWVLLL